MSGGSDGGGSGGKGGGDARATLAAGLILAAVAIGFALAPRVTAWADGISPGAGIFAGAAWAVLLIGGFVGIFWLRARGRR